MRGGNLRNWLVDLAERVDEVQHLEYKAKRLTLTDQEVKCGFFAPKPEEVIEDVVGMIERSGLDRKVVDELKGALEQGKRGWMEVARNGVQVAMKSPESCSHNLS